MKDGKTKRVGGTGGTDLNAKSFLHVPDEQDTNTWLLPVYDPSSVAKTQNLIKNHLARFAEMKAIPVSERARLWERLVGAAKAHGISVVDRNGVAPPAPSMVQQSTPAPVDPTIAEAIARADHRATELLRALGLE